MRQVHKFSHKKNTSCCAMSESVRIFWNVNHTQNVYWKRLSIAQLAIHRFPHRITPSPTNKDERDERQPSLTRGELLWLVFVETAHETN